MLPKETAEKPDFTMWGRVFFFLPANARRLFFVGVASALFLLPTMSL